MLPMKQVFAQDKFRSMFPVSTVPKLRQFSWHSLDQLPNVCLDSPTYILSSGSVAFLGELANTTGILQRSEGMWFAVDIDFTRYHRERDLDRHLSSWRLRMEQLGFRCTLVHHAEFGGVSNARHLIGHRGSGGCEVHPFDGLPRTLSHIVNPATAGHFPTIDVPPPVGAVGRRPVVVEGLMRKEGLFDVTASGTRIACPSVFSITRWVKRTLTRTETLRLWDIPPTLDDVLVDDKIVRLVGRAITPLIVSVIIRTSWSSAAGGVDVNNRLTTRLPVVVPRQQPKNLINIPQEDLNSSRSVHSTEANAAESKSRHDEDLKPLSVRTERQAANDRNRVSLSNSGNSSDTPWEHLPVEGEDTLACQLEVLKHHHNEAKAVKADDASVPIHLWNEFVLGDRAASDVVITGLCKLRQLGLRWYRRKLTRDCIKFLNAEHGREWKSLPRKAWSKKLIYDTDALREIATRGANNEWFEYPAGSRVHFFRFPTKYRNLARDGVPAYFVTPGPTQFKAQPPMQHAERTVLREKLLTMWKKRYIDAPPRKLSSAIMYFAVPKGVNDWRIVYHAGANGLNDSVWAPSFWLPTIDSLLRIVDETSYMEDRDLGEMFLNFELHLSTRRFTGVDVGPLEFSSEECPHRWLWWTKNLMGFRSSPYNSVKMYLIAEEIIRGDRLDGQNPFRWHHVELNLPGTPGYNPSKAWLTKRRVDGSLASDMVVFVDDKRLAGSSSNRTKKAGHASSTRESYLGIQDALRKWRSAGGTKTPGAWAGAVVHIDEELGVMVLTSQDKWDRMKEICRYWLAILRSGERSLEFKKLQSDRGFMVYATRAYPAMKPYLKGFHLSLEMWRGGRDEDGWKLPRSCYTEGEDLREEEAEGEEYEETQQENVKRANGPESGITSAVPRFESDLEALLELTASERPVRRVVRSRKILTVYYGFGDASSNGFGSTIQRGNGIQGRYGLWAAEDSDQSSNFRELLNLVETMEEEAATSELADTELWLFTDNSVAESCFFRGSSTSRLLHDLVVRMRKLEMDHSLTLHLIHVAGTRMIEQGTDGLSRGLLTEGVLAGKDMLSFIDISKTAVERQPSLVKYVESWTDDHLYWLSPEEWFNKGHGMWGGLPNADGIWIPTHAKNGRLYVWTPPPSVADVALEEALKSTHKRTDAFHIFLIPRLCTTRWLRMFYKLYTAHGLYEERRCWWTWSGNCVKCCVKVKEMDGIFCANFCKSRGGFPACRSAWHAECYECLGMGKFPMFCKEDVSGNAWCHQEDQEYILNHGVVGAHASIPFQCEKCWMINLERRLPVPGRDDAYVSFIRRANLDAIAGRSPSTSQSHARDIVRMVRNCSLIGKTPTIPPRGPMPLADPCGMGTAIDIILTSLTAKSRIKGQKFVQFGTARKIRGSFGAAWESSPQGIEEGSSFERGSGRGATFTSCPTQLKWFSCFVIGTETRMGHASSANKAISMNIILRILEMVKEEMAQADPINRRALCKFGAAMVVGVTASLRGPEIFKLDLAGIRAFIDLGRHGTIPANPLKKGKDLTNAPHVFYAFLGKFKGELGFEQHLVAIASNTQSGLEPRWWLEELIKTREEEHCTHGPAFGTSTTKASHGGEYDILLHQFMEAVQKESPDLISATDDVRANYGFFRSFRKTSETRARLAGLDGDTINAMNRWKTIERARGRRPRWSTMIEHYSDARELMPVTWRYSYVQ